MTLDDDDIEVTVYEGGGAVSSQSVGLGALLRTFALEPQSCSVMLVVLMLNIASSKTPSGQLILLLTASKPTGNSSLGSGGFGRPYVCWRRIAEVCQLH